MIAIRVTPGSFWDQLWAAFAHQPTLAARLKHEQTFVTVDRADLALVLSEATLDPQSSSRSWIAAEARTRLLAQMAEPCRVTRRSR